ncbi:uncharacterized protein LOC112505175 [Cynara cardunculus var. scolymus]|uniref:uncharacterized protein LOC112505175 n=1 Tax=Cynara cardunculus var. scolymus TaxID=59895 RepID=UPI000D62F0A9|nr:uncharacterized protein LOC112505175 [Cynara cardunculus var. scolymus]
MVRKNSNWSWVFRKLLDLRSHLRRFLFSQIGDGRNTNAWEDAWLSCGPLSAFISYRFVHSCGFSTLTTVCDLIISWNGNWPDDWCQRFDMLQNSPLPLLTSDCDRVLWGDTYTLCSDFTVGKAWASLEGNHPVIPWSKLVWFSGHIPKHAFCLWLACQRRLPTQDRLHWKDEPPDMECSLMVDMMGMPSRWEQIVQVISDPNIRPKLLKQKLAVAATVYYIWQERNRRRFAATKRTAQDVTAVIQESISIRADWLASRPVVTYG